MVDHEEKTAEAVLANSIEEDNDFTMNRKIGTYYEANKYFLTWACVTSPFRVHGIWLLGVLTSTAYKNKLPLPQTSRVYSYLPPWRAWHYGTPQAAS